MDELAIKIENVKKRYKLGTIGGGTLSAELQSWWARIRGKEDPNLSVEFDQKNIGKTFWALDGVSFEVKKGEAVGIIGANGAGKSTLLKLLSRVTSPTEGKIYINGRIASMLEVGTGFHPELTGRENIYMNGAILGMSRSEIDKKIEDIIAFSECRQFIDTPVKRYSSGMYVKLAFSVAAYLDSDIMIMDEVLAVGDVKFQKKCLGKMDGAAREEGKTILYVSHNMATIRQLCTRCIVLNKGRVIYDGDVETAISIYSNDEQGEIASKYVFETVKRPSFEHGRYFRIDSFEFVDREIPIYQNDEKIIWKMTYHSKQDMDDLGIYYTICYENDTIVGTMQTNELGSIREDECKECMGSMDISNLVPGMYYFYLDVFYKNEFRTFFSADHPLKRIYFKVEEQKNQKGILWNRRYFGNVRLNDLEILENVVR